MNPAADTRTQLAHDAFIWGLPLVIMGRYLELAAQKSAPLNQLFITPIIAVPKYRQLGPNIDTLMGHALIDLSDEPQIITVPEARDRYYSIQLQDMYMNNFSYIGRRTTGTGPGVFLLTPPGYAGPIPAGMTEIKAPTSKILAYIRTMLRAPEDLDAALEVHAHYTLGPLSAYPDGQRKPIARDDRATLFPHYDFTHGGPGFFQELDRLVRQYPPLPWDAPNLARFAAIGIGRDEPLPADAALQAELETTIPAAYERVLKTRQIQWKNGWGKMENTLDFFHDPLQRAANSAYGKGMHLSKEAVYYNTMVFAVGEWLTGETRYRLRFGPGETPPCDAFWSLTLYGSDHVLYDNVLNRYGILDRTDGLRYGADGSLEIQIQHDEPAEGISNWLPAPRGEYWLCLRAYQPHDIVLEDRYEPPPLVAVD